ncbi:hypothetical protein AVDCRST_MAG92-3392, partial [uncultured Coleofasciculus sp.]
PDQGGTIKITVVNFYFPLYKGRLRGASF